MKKSLVIIGLVLSIVALFFRGYLRGKLLFPSNLLVGFYSPWNTVSYPGWSAIPFKGLGSDNLMIFYPMKTLIREALQEHSFPLWTPYNFTGGPLWGDGQSAPMYPLTYLYLIPSLPDGFSLMVILVPTLTMLFTYALLRHWRLTRLGALFGAVAFAFSGFMSVWMEENPAVAQSAIWLPLLVLLTDLLVIQPKRRWFAAFAAVVAVMMASGFLQICLYELVLITAFGLFRIFTLKTPERIKWQRLALIILSGTIGLFLVSPYLTVTWEAYKLSPRDFVNVPEIRSIFLVQWSHIFSLFTPDWLGNPGTYNFFGVGSYYDKALFIGVIPLLFALIGLFTKKTSVERFLWWVTVVTLFMGFSSPFTQWLFSQPIPILSSMLPSRVFYLTTFAASMIAAIIFDRERRHNFDGLKKAFHSVCYIYLTLIILIEVFLLAYQTEIGLPGFRAGAIAQTIRMAFVSAMKVTAGYPSVAVRNIAISVVITAGALIIILIGKRYKQIAFYIPFVLFIATVGSAWYFTNKSLYFGERQFVYPTNPVIAALQSLTGIDRIGYANAASRIPAGSNVVYGLYTPEGLNPVFPLRYGQLLQSAVNGGKLTDEIPRISVQFDLERAHVDATSSAARMTKLMNLLDMKYIVERKESGWYKDVFPNHSVVWDGKFFRIWKNPDTLPRAFIATTIMTEKNPQKILDDLYRVNLRVTAITDVPVEAIPGTNSASVTSYKMDNLTISYTAASPGLLVVTDNWAPGWRASIDGKEVPVYRADFTFRGVPVPAGHHTVFMYYWPQSIIFGIYLSSAGILLLLCGIFFIRWRSVS